jgi:DNA-binding PadR family transcriptional regulator
LGRDVYELIILSLSVRSPMHGYQMLKIVNDVIGPFARLSNGRFYPLLSKLEEVGVIFAVEGSGGHFLSPSRCSPSPLWLSN